MLHSTFELLIVERSHTYAKTITGYYTCAHLALLPSSSSISLTLPGLLMKMPHVTYPVALSLPQRMSEYMSTIQKMDLNKIGK